MFHLDILQVRNSNRILSLASKAEFKPDFKTHISKP